MKNIVLAAGYATRLGELTKNFPKPLLEIGNSTILGRMLDDIDTIDEINEHIIVTNHKFAPIFEKWAPEQRYSKPVTIIDDGSTTNGSWILPVRRIQAALCVINSRVSRNCSGQVSWNWMPTTAC